MNSSVIVLHMQDRPGSTTEDEAAHTFDKLIHEVLVQCPKYLARNRLHRVIDRTGEDGEQLHKVTATETALRCRSAYQSTAHQQKGSIFNHPVDEPVKLVSVNTGEVRHAGQVIPGFLARHAVIGKSHRQQLMNENSPAAITDFHTLDPA